MNYTRFETPRHKALFDPLRIFNDIEKIVAKGENAGNHISFFPLLL